MQSAPGMATGGSLENVTGQSSINSQQSSSSPRRESPQQRQARMQKRVNKSKKNLVLVQGSPNKQLQESPEMAKETEEENRYRINCIIELLQRQMEIELQDIDTYRIDELLKSVSQLSEKNLDDMIYLDLVQVLRYEHHRKGDYIFKHGDYADRFFIMLRGRASIQLPQAVADQRKRDQQLKALQVNKEDQQQDTSHGDQQSHPDEEPLDAQPKMTLRLTPVSAPHFSTVLQQPSLQVQEERIIKEELLEESVELSPHFQSPNLEATIQPESQESHQQPSSESKRLKKRKTLAKKLQTSAERKEVQKSHTTLLKGEELEKNLNSLNLIEVARVRQGAGFGEEVLETTGNVERVGIVKCLTECHLGVINKHDFHKIIKRWEDRQKEERIKFYRHTPFFTTWTRSMLLKLIPCFQTRYYKKDQVVLHEGFDQVAEWGSRYLFMIKEGDFEVVKTIRYFKEDKNAHVGLEVIANKIDIVKFMEARHDEVGKGEGSSSNQKKPESTGPLLISPRHAMDLTPNEQLYQPRPSEVTFLILGPGQIFGDEALLTTKEDGSGGLPLYSVRCKSAMGEVLIVSQDDYINRIKCNPRSLRIIEDNCEQKAQMVEELLTSPCSYINLPKALKTLKEDAEAEQLALEAQNLDLNRQVSFTSPRAAVQLSYNTSLQNKQQQVLIDTQNSIGIFDAINTTVNTVVMSPQNRQGGSQSHFGEVIRQSNNQAPKVQGSAVMIKRKPPLLNKREEDKRQTLAEVVKDYPCVKPQKRIVSTHYQQSSQASEASTYQESCSAPSQDSSQLSFKRHLGTALSDSHNKEEFIDIFKRKLMQRAMKDYENAPQDHLKLFDLFLRSQEVRTKNRPKKKHYMSSLVGDAIEANEGIEQPTNSELQRRTARPTTQSGTLRRSLNSLLSHRANSKQPSEPHRLLNNTTAAETVLSSPTFQTEVRGLMNQRVPSHLIPHVRQSMDSLGQKAQFTQEIFQNYSSTKSVRYMALANTMFSGAVQTFNQALSPRTSGTNILQQVKSPVFRPMQAMNRYASNNAKVFQHASSMPVMQHGDEVMTNHRVNTAISASRRRRQIMVVDDEN